MWGEVTFREQALAKRTQKEELDGLLKVTAPHEGIFLAGLGAIIVATLRCLMDFEAGKRQSDALITGMLPLEQNVAAVLAAADLV